MTSNSPTGVCDSSVRSGVLRREQLGELLLRRQEHALADDVVLGVEQAVDRLEAEVGHADPVGVRETPARRAADRRAACGCSRFLSRGWPVRVRAVARTSMVRVRLEPDVGVSTAVDLSSSTTRDRRRRSSRAVGHLTLAPPGAGGTPARRRRRGSRDPRSKPSRHRVTQPRSTRQRPRGRHARHPTAEPASADRAAAAARSTVAGRHRHARGARLGAQPRAASV